MGRIATGWQITKQSFSVIKHDKEIVLFPILSLLLIIGFSVLFFFVIIMPMFLSHLIYQNVTALNITFFFLTFIYLIVVYFIGIYFEAAIITSATIRFSGRNPTFGEGLAGPSKRIHALVIWAVINAVITIILNALQNLGKRGGRGVQIGTQVATSLFGMAWNLLTFFSIPLIVLEKESAFSSIPRSKDLFKKTWGENITAQLTTGGIFFVISLPIIALCLLAAFFGGPIGVGIGATVALFWIALILVISTSVNGILKAALYHYATTQQLPEIYSPEVSAAMIGRN